MHPIYRLPGHGRAPSLGRGLLAACLLCVSLSSTGAEAPLRGVFLVAAPELSELPFAGSVILLRRHARGGTIGVIVNRPTETDLRETFPHNDWLDERARWLYEGGPSDPEQLLVLVRTRAHAPRNALRVFDNVFLSHDMQLLEDVMRHPRPMLGVRVLRGHVRWAQGVLEEEIAAGRWLLAEADGEVLFATAPTTLWQRLVAQVDGRRVDTMPRFRAPRAAPAAATARAIPHW